MPPKRKQTDDAAEAGTSTRSTRASARTSTAKNTAASKKTTTKKATSNVAEEDSDATESVHSTKKARTAAPKKAAARGGRKKGGKDDTEPDVPRKPPSFKEAPQPKVAKTNNEPIFAPHVSKSNPPTAPTPAPPSPPPAKPNTPPTMTAPANTATAKKVGKVEPYTAQRALDLFTTYVDPDTPDAIGPEGFQQLCEDASMPMEGARPLIFAWQIESPEMGKITKEGWVKMMGTFKIASVPGISIAMSELEELLYKEKTPKNAGKDYDKAAFNVHSANPKAAFQKLYMFSFNLVKPEQSKNIDMETSVAFWTALLVPKYPLMSEIIDFINENKGSYKATNKDLWSMMLEFCETVKPTLQDYEADGAWPTLLDDFVAWKSTQLANGNADNMEEN